MAAVAMYVSTCLAVITPGSRPSRSTCVRHPACCPTHAPPKPHWPHSAAGTASRRTSTFIHRANGFPGLHLECPCIAAAKLKARCKSADQPRHAVTRFKRKWSCAKGSVFSAVTCGLCEKFLRKGFEHGTHPAVGPGQQVRRVFHLRAFLQPDVQERAHIRRVRLFLQFQRQP